jgi:hypothetical protein
MAKIDVNKVAEILKKNQLHPNLLRQIVEEMNILTQADSDEEKPPAVKKQFAVLVSDPNSLIPKDAEFVAWVAQIPESENIKTVETRLRTAAYEFNTTKKGRLHPVITVGEAFMHVAPKHFKEVDLSVKTKEPVLVLITNNKIPTEKTTKKDRI